MTINRVVQKLCWNGDFTPNWRLEEEAELVGPCMEHCITGVHSSLPLFLCPPSCLHRPLSHQDRRMLERRMAELEEELKVRQVLCTSAAFKIIKRLDKFSSCNAANHDSRIQWKKVKTLPYKYSVKLNVNKAIKFLKIDKKAAAERKALWDIKVRI